MFLSAPMQVKICNVLVQDENGKQKWIQLTENYLNDNHLNEGDVIELDSDIYSNY